MPKKFSWDDKTEKLTIRMTLMDKRLLENYCRKKGVSKQSVILDFIRSLSNKE